MAKLIKNGEILCYGTVGSGFFDDSGFFNSLDVAEALAEIGRKKDVTVRINSGGGDAFEGMAIHSQFASHKGKVTMVVDSIAASAASTIAMAGDQIIIKRGAMMMIHDPSGFTAGTIEDHKKSIEALTVLAESMADVYAERSGKTDVETRKQMREEIWLTAEDAVEEGYADKIDSGRARAVAKWDYQSYRHAPDRYVALAKSNGWTMRHRASQASDDAAQKEGSEMANGKSGGNDGAHDDINAAVTAEVERQLKARDDAAKEAAGKKEQKPTAEAGAVETTEEMTKRIRTEEQKRTADITAACNLAGQASKAAEFIAAGKSLSDVVTALQELRASGSNKGGTQTSEKEINNHRSEPGATTEVDGTKAWGRITSRLNKKVKSQREAMSA